MPDNQGSSTRPYLLRALHEWCTDNGFTPYIAVHVGAHVQVPMEYVKNNEIVLNIGFEATSSLELGNEAVQFRARFGGVSRDIVVPVDHVVAIYARENGQGMAFPMPSLADSGGVAAPKVAGVPKVPAAPMLRLATIDGAGSSAADDVGGVVEPEPKSAAAKFRTPGPKPARVLHSAKKPVDLSDAPLAEQSAVPDSQDVEDAGSASAQATEADGKKGAKIGSKTENNGDIKAADKPTDKPPAGPRPTLKRVK